MWKKLGCYELMMMRILHRATPKETEGPIPADKLISQREIQNQVLMMTIVFHPFHQDF